MYMNIIPSIITKYAYVEKDNDWIDPDSLHSQHHLVGNVPIEDILQRMNQGFHLPKSLENYGVPVGLLVMPNSSGYRRLPTELVVGGVNAPLPQTCSHMQGGQGSSEAMNPTTNVIGDRRSLETFGGVIKKKHQELPHTISDNDHERLMKFIHIYTDKGIKGIKNKNDKTHKKRK